MKMTKRRGLALVALSLLAAGLASIVFFAPPEPRHLGLPVSAWLDKYQSGRNDDRKAADEAFRAMGSNAVPVLVALMRAKDSKFKAGLSRLLAKQSAIKYSYHPPGTRQPSIVWALEAMGRAGRSAAPALLNLLDRPDRAYFAINGLMAVGVEDKAAYERCLLNPEFVVRQCAAGALSRLADGKSMRVTWGTFWPRGPGTNATPQPITILSVPSRAEISPSAVVPPLVERMTDPDPRVRRAAVVALADFGKPYPSKAVPAAQAALSDADARVREAATNTLRIITKEK